MKNKSTHKRVIRHRRNTRKNGKYGGMNPGAAEFVPGQYTPPLPPPPPMELTPEMRAQIQFMLGIMNAVAVDCEMVGVGPGRSNALAHVAIVDFNGNQIYNKYVIPPGGIDSITNERTAYSGITKNLLRNPEMRAEPYSVVKAEVHALLRGRTIVGHGLNSDFTVLEYDPAYNIVWDTAMIEGYMQNGQRIYLPNGTSQVKKQPRKLKALAMEIAGNNIQRNERNPNGTRKGHSPLEDARASMNLYRINYGFPKVLYRNMGVA